MARRPRASSTRRRHARSRVTHVTHVTHATASGLFYQGTAHCRYARYTRYTRDALRTRSATRCARYASCAPLHQEFRTLHEVSFVGAAAWLFFISGMVCIVLGILLLEPTEKDKIDPDKMARISRPSLAGREWSPSFLATTGMYPGGEHQKATFGLGTPSSSQKDGGVKVDSPYSRKTYGSMLDEVAVT